MQPSSASRVALRLTLERSARLEELSPAPGTGGQAPQRQELGAEWDALAHRLAAAAENDRLAAVGLDGIMAQTLMSRTGEEASRTALGAVARGPCGVRAAGRGQWNRPVPTRGLFPRFNAEFKCAANSANFASP